MIDFRIYMNFINYNSGIIYREKENIRENIFEILGEPPRGDRRAISRAGAERNSSQTALR